MLSLFSPRFVLLSAAFHGFAAVALGAFGAHALRERFEGAEGIKFQGWWTTATQYQLAHAVALLGLAALLSRQPSGAASLAGACFTFGALVFSGTLYAMALGGPRWLGAITPIGGLLLLAAWVSVFVAALKSY